MPNPTATVEARVVQSDTGIEVATIHGEDATLAKVVFDLGVPTEATGFLTGWAVGALQESIREALDGRAGHVSDAVNGNPATVTAARALLAALDTAF